MKVSDLTHLKKVTAIADGLAECYNSCSDIIASIDAFFEDEISANRIGGQIEISVNVPVSKSGNRVAYQLKIPMDWTNVQAVRAWLLKTRNTVAMAFSKLDPGVALPVYPDPAETPQA